MNPPQPFFAWTRRRFMGTLAATTAIPLIPAELFAEDLAAMPFMTEGPFYPDTLPLDTDNDLLVINDAAKPGLGTIAYLSGRVLDIKGNPVRNATVEIWQCDNNGVYYHSRDSGRRLGERDLHFQSFGRTITGADGTYNFRTIKPVPYTGRTPHIHVKVWLGGRDILTSQILVKEYAKQNARDGLARRLGDKLPLVVADFKTLKGSKIGSVHATYDIILGKTPSDKR